MGLKLFNNLQMIKNKPVEYLFLRTSKQQDGVTHRPESPQKLSLAQVQDKSFSRVRESYIITDNDGVVMMMIHYYWQWWCSDDDDDDDDDVPVDEGNVDDYDQSLPPYLTWWTVAASLWFRSRTDQAAVWASTIQWPASEHGTKHEQNIYHFNHRNSFNHGWILHQLLCPYEYSYRWKTDRMSQMMYLCYLGLWKQG